MVMASSWSWVTWMKVRPTSCWMRLSSICICRRSLRSSAPSGSSSSSTSGRLTRARASATRCCMPPESWLGFLPPAWPSSTSSSASCAFVLKSLSPRRFEPERDVVHDAHVREERVGLEHRVDVALVGAGRRDVGVADEDLAGGRRLEPRDHPQRRRLAAARGAEQREERALRDRQVEGVDGGELTERLGQPDELEVPGPVLGHQLAVRSEKARLYLVSSSAVRPRKTLARESTSAVGKMSGLLASVRVVLGEGLLGALHRRDVVDVGLDLRHDRRVVVVVDERLGVLLVLGEGRDDEVVRPQGEAGLRQRVAAPCRCRTGAGRRHRSRRRRRRCRPW